MIDLVLKPHGAYQYRWDRDESGWNEVQTVLGPFANYSPGDDEPSLSFWGDTQSGVTITIFAKTDVYGAIAIPRELIDAVIDIRIREKGEERWLQYATMSITPGKDRWEETFAKIVLTYR